MILEGATYFLSLNRLTARVMLVACLLAAQAAAAASVAEREMIIWSGATTRTDANRQLENFHPYEDALEDFVVVHPEVVESARVPGLKPGFFVVTLGVCDKEKAQAFLEIFNAIEPAVYAKPVHFDSDAAFSALECPSMAQAAADDDDRPVYWQFGNAVKASTKGGTLIALPFSSDWSERGDFAREYFEARVELLLVSLARILLASEQYKGPSDATKIKATERFAHGVSWLVEYADPPCDPSGDHFVSWKQTVQATSDGAHIRIASGKAQRQQEGQCGYAEERKAISGGSKKH